MAAGHLHFAWVDEGETFSVATHARYDEVVFRAEWAESEGEFATARVTMRAPAEGLLAPGRKRWCHIAVLDGGGSVVHVFHGRLSGFPIGVAADGTVEVEFVARPTGWVSQRDAFVEAQGLLTRPWFDDLFQSSGRRLDPVEILDGRTQVFRWDRRTLDPSLTDIVRGSSTVDIGTAWYDDSLSADLAEPAAKRARVTVTAEWTQQDGGYLDLTPSVLAAFGSSASGGRFGTLTGEDFASRWPAAGETLGDSGYAVAESVLRERADLDESSYPRRTVLMTFAPDGLPALANGSSAQRRLPIAWYEPRLTLRWGRQQKRIERVSFAMDSGIQDVFGDGAEDIVLDLKLEDITKDTETPAWAPGAAYSVGDYVLRLGARYQCAVAHTSSSNFDGDILYAIIPGYEYGQRWLLMPTDASPLGGVGNGTFFLRPRGREAVHHAMLVARAQLLAAARCVEVRFQPTDFLGSLGWTTAMAASISAPERLPGGAASGKIRAIRWWIDGDAGDAGCEVTLACCPGTGAAPSVGAGQIEIPASGETWDQIAYTDYVAGASVVGLPSVSGIVDAYHGYADQAAYCSANGSISTPAQSLLDAVPTAMFVRLTDLTSAPDLEATHQVASCAVGVPRQIDLEAAP